MREIIHQRFERLKAFLRQGLTPEKLALCFALGVALGICPVLGSTTFLCLAVGLTVRVNQVVLQSINFSIYPLQVVLLIPFFRLGERIFNVPPLPISVEGVIMLINSGDAPRIIGFTTLRAIVAWMLVAPAVGVTVYFVMLPILHHVRLPKVSSS